MKTIEIEVLEYYKPPRLPAAVYGKYKIHNGPNGKYITYRGRNILLTEENMAEGVIKFNVTLTDKEIEENDS